MKTRISISLPNDLLAALDDLAGVGGSRSAVVERVLREHLARRASGVGAAGDASALARTGEMLALNRHADRTRAASAEALDYQAPWPGA